MSLKKILYITPAMPVGGAEKFLLNVSAAFTADTSEQTIVSLSDTNTLSTDIDPQVKFVALPRRSKFDLGPVRQLRKMIRTEKPDIIFCINFFSYFIMRCALLGLSTNCRRIISYHSTKHLTRKEHLLHKLYAAILTKKDEIITVSVKQTDYAIKTYGIAPEKFKVIHNCVDTTYWKPDANDDGRITIRREYGIPLDANVIILTAAFRPEKNHVGAIEALQLLHTRYNQVAYLLFVGDGVLREEITRSIKAFKMQDYVKMTGLQKKVLPFYRSADIFTLCSKNVETFSIAALEAMACGLPGVLTNVGGAPEMISEGINGFICEEDEDSIARGWLKAIQHDFSKETIHNYAAAHFNQEKMISEYKSLLGL